MINTKDIEPEKLSVTIALISAEATKRNWQVFVPHESSPLAFIDRGKGEVLRIFSATPPTTSYAAAYLANDKLATHRLLEDRGFPVMQTALLRKDEPLSSEVLALLSSGAVVVKPIDSGHGKGITTNITTQDGLIAAIAYAHEFTKSNDSIIVQRMYEKPLDLRLLCIGGKMVAASIRQPARVFGDGTKTIGQLIAQENTTKRGIPYRSDLAFIDADRATQYLGNRIQEIPEYGQYVSVIGTANIGSGGEAIDCTDDIPAWMSALACEIAAAADLPVCGVDFMVTHTPHAESTREELNPAITEINKCPSFGLHHQPTIGVAHDVTSAYFDYLETL